MKIHQLHNGNLIIEVDVNDHVDIRGASIDVKLSERSNISRRPVSASNVDVVSLTGIPRAESDYPEPEQSKQS